MYSQPKHLSDELILCIHITRVRVDFNRDSGAKSHRWCRVVNLRPSNPDLLCFAAVQDLTIFMAPQGPAPFKWLVLWGTTLHFVQWIQTQIIRTLCGRSIPCPNNVTLRVLAHQLLRALTFPNEVLKDLEKSWPGKISCRDGWRQFERRNFCKMIFLWWWILMTSSSYFPLNEWNALEFRSGCWT